MEVNIKTSRELTAQEKESIEDYFGHEVALDDKTIDGDLVIYCYFVGCDDHEEEIELTDEQEDYNRKMAMGVCGLVDKFLEKEKIGYTWIEGFGDWAMRELKAKDFTCRKHSLGNLPYAIEYWKQRDSNVVARYDITSCQDIIE